MTTRALIVSAPCSGAGKTSVSIGLMRAFARKGLRVQGIKSGPDFIDPGFHKAATNRSGLNLDSWAMEHDLLHHFMHHVAQECDLLVIEGAMGLFDGIPAGDNRTGSVADIARILNIPVLLVLDVSGQAQTAAAVAKGFELFDPDVTIAGVLLNRVASERHRTLIETAMRKAETPFAGAVMRNSVPVLSERYLGLVQASEYEALEKFIEQLADVMEASLDLDTVLSLAAPINIPSASGDKALPPPGQRIALAQDAAFTFVYPHILDHWYRQGSEIVSFSPLADEIPPKDCDICWLPGGYPELYAGALSAAQRFREGVSAFAKTKPVHGECGGYMVLGQYLEDAEGCTYEMTGLLAHGTSLKKRRMNLGYRKARLLQSHVLGNNGDVIRGHEFHYATVMATGNNLPLVEMTDGLDNSLGEAGSRDGFVSGTFFHAIARS